MTDSDRIAALERRVVAAAVKTDDGLIHFMPAPCRHHHTVHALHRVDNAAENDFILARPDTEGSGK